MSVPREFLRLSRPDASRPDKRLGLKWPLGVEDIPGPVAKLRVGVVNGSSGNAGPEQNPR
jgi:hypothetical protein